MTGHRQVAAALLLAMAILLAACGGGQTVDEAAAPTPPPPQQQTEAPTPEATTPPGPQSSPPAAPETEGAEETEEFDGRDPDARYGADVCVALLPALDGDLEGLDRYASSPVLELLSADAAPGRSGDAEVSETGDLACTIALVDEWVTLELIGDGHVGHTAVSASWSTDHTDGPPVEDREAIADAVAAYREGPDACEGGAQPLPEGMGDHEAIAVEGITVVAVVCDTFAYQSLFELLRWDGTALVAMTVEQWRGSLVHSPMVLGYPLVFHGPLENLEKHRGIGDCGLYQVWFVEDSERLRLFEARERQCSADDYVPPEEWPAVYVAGE